MDARKEESRDKLKWSAAEEALASAKERKRAKKREKESQCIHHPEQKILLIQLRGCRVAGDVGQEREGQTGD